ncbi:hypothetical protein RHMOL_Rhmol03G0191200 [Rhododendron molle]|uniref:Uncharacterized protein n=3 Tax=Rhododendron molle TaxID=49168 RepID=A0ACC0PF28_RHOML|nr:hypothetical protein RHMOL_Rhmol09G0231400 [Rhododendron molle]KAI8563322.1 hypothetical protein RHMOL_Rhmol03G0103300 [Rhododendron molle]KAI8564576.1 hypothetical protein RHMOL_Rhmol03G0191200 [Rhododendron molle]
MVFYFTDSTTQCSRGWDAQIAMHNANDWKTDSIKSIIVKVHFVVYNFSESLLRFYICQCSYNITCLFTALVSSFRPFYEVRYTAGIYRFAEIGKILSITYIYIPVNLRLLTWPFAIFRSYLNTSRHYVINIIVKNLY